ncbi:hypothetical protein ACLOJK_003572 [Asimina triloba]
MLTDADYALVIRMLGKRKMPDAALQLFHEMKSAGFAPSAVSLSALMLCYADTGLFAHAQAIWDEIINSSFIPEINVISDLFDTYGKMGHFGEIHRIVNELTSRDWALCPKLYSLAISCFGKYGQLEMMEVVMKKMVSKGFKVDSVTGNAFVRFYSLFGSLAEMEAAYGRLKRSRILIEEDAIRAMAFSYISKRRFYKLGEFLRDVGLGRRNTRNLLWNLLLLSYAANFRMKSLQREFLRMLDAGFSPDLTTFNIRALAFSRMSMFWDLHLSIEHMKYEKVAPDLVTYGCLVDAYVNHRLGRNLSFALDSMNVADSPVILTDPLVFEAFGKGDFHLTSELLLESKKQSTWTYERLIRIYLKKQYRINQIYWNY